MTTPAPEWTQERLEQVGQEWQKRLFLLDWEIAFRLVNIYEVDGSYASCTRHSAKKRKAIIRVSDPVHHSASMAAEQDADPEYSLVHELLHLHLYPLKDAVARIEEVGGAIVKPLTDMAYDECRDAEERAIHDLARAYVNLKRQASA